MKRKGMGKGKGKGYKNIQGRDSRIHSQSAKGMKQPQKIGRLDFVVNKQTNVRGQVTKLNPFVVKTFTTDGKMIHKKISNEKFWDKDTDGDGKIDKIDCDIFNAKKQDLTKKKLEEVTIDDVPEDIKREIIAKSQEFNGWSNHSTWALKLWIDNTSETQSYWQERAKKLSRVELMDELKEWYEKIYDDVLDGKEGVNQEMRGMVKDTGHYSDVNYREIAINLQEEN